MEPSNRFNVVVAEIQRIVEKNRRNGDVYEKAAFDIYRDCDLVLAAFKTCERIITTPIPYQYTHMVNLVLFFFVYSAPLIFTVTFKWITPFPSAILALGFFGGVASLLPSMEVQEKLVQTLTPLFYLVFEACFSVATTVESTRNNK